MWGYEALDALREIVIKGTAKAFPEDLLAEIERNLGGEPYTRGNVLAASVLTVLRMAEQMHGAKRLASEEAVPFDHSPKDEPAADIAKPVEKKRRKR